jgi:hypothetical protein
MRFLVVHHISDDLQFVVNEKVRRTNSLQYKNENWLKLW